MNKTNHMKRRDFIKKSTIAVGLAGSFDVLPALKTSADDSQPPSGEAAAPHQDNRSADYFRRAQSDQLLPKLLEFASVTMTPMPLAERVRRKIVPRRGFCSLSPGSGALLSGTGTVNIELEGDPFNEQIPFRHEMLYVPRKRPAECPNIADVFPQVRQMLLDGKYHEAAALAYQKWHANPVQGGGMGFGGGRL